MKKIKILDKRFLKIIQNFKKQNKKIVFTNGCFDLIHPGHVHYLKKAKSFGDVLIVAINSDKSVRKLKGVDRPIMSWNSRADIIQGLESVDYVIKMNENNPISLIKKIKPDIHVKGGDYKINELSERQAVINSGGMVKIVKYLSGLSTSQLISKIRSKKIRL